MTTADAKQPQPAPGQPDSSAAILYEHVGFRYPGSDQPVLEDISLRVEPAERLGILGPNGGGKTTLLKLTIGMLTGHTGQIHVMGRSPSDVRRRGLIGYVPQRTDAELAFPLTVRDAVQLPIALGRKPWQALDAAARDAADHAMETVGAAALADTRIGKLSGGQLQRVLVARAIATRPSILILDEPTVGIDVPGQEQFARMLAAIHQDLAPTIVIVSHDLRAIAASCDRVACLRRTLHAHTSPKGLTPQVLAEVFEHDVAPTFGNIHVHAHKANECPLDAHERDETPHADH